MIFRFKKMAGIGLALASVLTLSACYDDGYGYGGVSVGYGSGGYYGDPWYGYPRHYGWYDGFYYPGHGYWLYDRRGHRHRWNDHHRRHWEGRREQWRNRDRNHEHVDRGVIRRGDGNWRGRDGRGGENRGWRGNRGEWSNRQATPSVGDRSWRSERGSRGDGGVSARSGRGERSAPGPMGHVFDRRWRDR